jgi:hypothetical protein
VQGTRRGRLTQEEGKVPGKAGLAGMHRGGGAMTRRRGWLRIAAFRWRGGLGDLQRPQGRGGPVARDRGEGGVSGGMIRVE